ncbi:hypothetical protein KEM54_005047, partial [Ascosphaera aggregata]
MYHWKILSFVIFSSAFWITSMLFAGATWICLASGGILRDVEGLSTDDTSIKREEHDDDDDDDDDDDGDGDGDGDGGDGGDDG